MQLQIEYLQIPVTKQTFHSFSSTFQTFQSFSDEYQLPIQYLNSVLRMSTAAATHDQVCCE